MIHIGDGDVGSRSMWEYKEIGGGWRNVRSVGPGFNCWAIKMIMQA